MTDTELAILLEAGTQQFIREHASDDPYALALQAKRFPNIPIQQVAEQIQARQKAKKKLPEWYQTEGVIFPPSLAMEQCSSEATARFKSSLVSGTSVVDLTGGAGIDTYYLSRSFERGAYVEQNSRLAAIAQHNFRQLGASSIEIHATDAEAFLSSMEAVDLIYLDPARRDDAQRKVFRLSDCSPDVTSMLPGLLIKGKQVMIKTSPMLDIDAAMNDLGNVDQVYVVAVNNECKEVLYLLSSQVVASPMITALDLANGAAPLQFAREGETKASVSYAEPQRYLYEPHAAILKAGAFRSVAQQYGVAKLHPRTHLYTSEQLVANFPGRTFRIQSVAPYQKKVVRKYVPEGKANISTRNFGDSVATVRKKLGLQEGGDAYLFATATQLQNRVILITQKI
ncbi:MAG: RsmD family RNA methyltransferase [Cyclobacteriaceae bacterium]